MKKLIIISSVVIIILLSIVTYKTLQVPEMPVHVHANFAIFVDGKQIDFAKPDYMSLKPCTENQEPSVNKLDNVHLHDNVGNVVHVHQDGITWNDLLQSLRFDINSQSDVSKNLTSKIYLDKNLVDSKILSENIKQDQHLLISINNLDAFTSIDQSETLKSQYQQVGDNAHTYSEHSASESCSGTSPYTFTQRFKIMLYTNYKSLQSKQF
jgi:hypothetical protein